VYFERRGIGGGDRRKNNGGGRERRKIYRKDALNYEVSNDPCGTPQRGVCVEIKNRQNGGKGAGRTGVGIGWSGKGPSGGASITEDYQRRAFIDKRDLMTTKVFFSESSTGTDAPHCDKQKMAKNRELSGLNLIFLIARAHRRMREEAKFRRRRS